MHCSTLHPCLSQAIFLTLVLTDCLSGLLLKPSFISGRNWEDTEEQKLKVEHACQQMYFCLPDLFCYSKKFSKTTGNTKEMLGSPALYHSNHMLFTICSFNRMADCLNSKAWQADALDISIRLTSLIRWEWFSSSLHQWPFLPLKIIRRTFWEVFPMQLMLLSATTCVPFGLGWKCLSLSCYRDQNWTPALAAVSSACHHT